MKKNVIFLILNESGLILNVRPGDDADFLLFRVVLFKFRPIDITLSRCWRQMPWRERAKLALVLAQAAGRSDQVSAAVASQIESLEREFDLDLVFQQVLDEFPSLQVRWFENDPPSYPPYPQRGARRRC